MSVDFLSSLTAPALNAPESGIVGVANYGRLKAELIPLWVGEGDLPTPRFICEAATRSLAAGETYYTWQRGVPELRKAIARYIERTHGKPSDPERFFVTGSGMQSIQIVATMLAGEGDEVIVPTPAWPNFAAAIGIRGARPVEVPLTLDGAGWQLDLSRVEAAITPRTRAIFINSPCNPTGWTADRDELQAILDMARRHDLWIIADEIYARFVYGAEKVAPSFHDFATDDDKIIYVNTFSKNWAMTGWRIGWIEAPPALGDVIENLIQYSTSGVAVFLQRAATVALEQGDSFIDHQVLRVRDNLDLLSATLTASGKVRFARPGGAFYLFLAIEGESDSRSLALRLIDEAGIGLAPGTAFGDGGQGYVRLCFARSPESMRETSDRLLNWLVNHA